MWQVRRASCHTTTLYMVWASGVAEHGRLRQVGQMTFQLWSAADRTVVFENEHGDRFTSQFWSYDLSGMRSDVVWKEPDDLTPREGRRRVTEADEFAIKRARDEGWLNS